MVSEGPAEVLRGRRDEREALERLLEAVRGGQSRVLVISGAPGVGKTALVESGIGPASGVVVMRAAVGESGVCSSWTRRCLIGSVGPLPRSRMRSGSRSGCVLGERRIGFWWGWRR